VTAPHLEAKITRKKLHLGRE